MSKVKNLGPWGISGGVQPFQGGVPGGGATGAARQSQWDHHLDQCKIMYNNEYIMNNDEFSCKFKVVLLFLFGCNVFTELAKVMLN